MSQGLFRISTPSNLPKLLNENGYPLQENTRKPSRCPAMTTRSKAQMMECISACAVTKTGVL